MRDAAKPGWQLILVGVCGIAGAVGLGYWWLTLPVEHDRPQPTARTSAAEQQSRLSDSIDLSTIELPETDRPLSAVEQLARKQDVVLDNWDTEQMSDAAVQQLSQLQALLSANVPIVEDAVSSLVNESFACGPLRPVNLTEVFRHGPIQVLRPMAGASKSSDHVGAAGLAEALENLRTTLGPGTDRYAKFKLIRIESQSDGWATHVRLETQNASAAESREQTAAWLCRWVLPAGEPSPRLIQIQLQDYEETRIEIRGGRLFADCTESIMSKNVAYARQVVPGINHWLTRVPREFMGPFGHHGIAVGDVNGDGWDSTLR